MFLPTAALSFPLQVVERQASFNISNLSCPFVLSYVVNTSKWLKRFFFLRYQASVKPAAL